MQIKLINKFKPIWQKKKPVKIGADTQDKGDSNLSNSNDLTWQPEDSFSSDDQSSTGQHHKLNPSALPAEDTKSKSSRDIVDLVRQGVVGQRHSIQTPFGQRQLVYADYTASGRFLTQIEDFFHDKIAPLYANTHTEASATGAQTTMLREEARSIIAKNVNAPTDVYATLFVGTGCTGALEKMIKVLGISLPKYADEKWDLSSKIPEEERPVVFIGPFEHHSNELPWRESLATVVVIPEDKYGCPDVKVLEKKLKQYSDRTIKIGSFSAGSNVSGICIDARKIATLLHKVRYRYVRVLMASCCKHNLQYFLTNFTLLYCSLLAVQRTGLF